MFRRRSLFSFGLFLILFQAVTPAFAANLWWCGLTSTAFGTATNWSNTPGCASDAGAAPGVADVAIFSRESGGKNVLISAAVADVKGIIVGAAYTGTILQYNQLKVGTSGFRMGSGYFIGSTAPITLSGSLTMTGGVMRGIQSRFTLSGSLSLTKGGGSAYAIFTNTGTLAFNGARASQTMYLGQDVVSRFNNLTLTNKGSAGSNVLSPNMSGSLLLSGAVVINQGKLNMATNSKALVVRNGINILPNSLASLTTDSNVTLSGSLIVSPDSAGLAVTAGTWTANSTTNQTWNLGQNHLYHVTVNNTALAASQNALTISGSSLALSGSLTLTQGTLNLAAFSKKLTVDGNITVASNALANLSGSTIDLAGDFTMGASGHMDHRGGTFTLDGNSQTIYGSSSFYNLYKVPTTTGLTLYFEAGSQQNINGTVTLGNSTYRMKLRSTSNGTQWRFAPETRSVTNLDVMDSRNTHATEINCSATCVDSGNNTNWALPAVASSGGSSTTTSGGGGGGGGGGGSRSRSATSSVSSTQGKSSSSKAAKPPSPAAKKRQELRQDRLKKAAAARAARAAKAKAKKAAAKSASSKKSSGSNSSK